VRSNNYNLHGNASIAPVSWLELRYDIRYGWSRSRYSEESNTVTSLTHIRNESNPSRCSIAFEPLFHRHRTMVRRRWNNEQERKKRKSKAAEEQIRAYEGTIQGTRKGKIHPRPLPSGRGEAGTRKGQIGHDDGDNKRNEDGEKKRR